MRPLLAKIIAGSFAAWLTLAFNACPVMIRQAALVMVAFIGIDTVTGVIVAALGARVQSRKLTRQLIAKSLQYALLLTLAGGAALLTQNWFVLEAGLCAVVAIEAISMLENLTALEAVGVNLGPARPLLQRLARILETQPEGETLKRPPLPPDPSEKIERKE